MYILNNNVQDSILKNEGFVLIDCKIKTSAIAKEVQIFKDNTFENFT